MCNRYYNNIVIIDDNEYKREASIRALSSLCENLNFFEFSSGTSALSFLERCSIKINLIILDWNFPLLDEGMPEIGMGEEILEEMERKNMTIDTIICSSDEVNIKEEYDNVIGKILYNSSVSMVSLYRDILGQQRLFEWREINFLLGIESAESEEKVFEEESTWYPEYGINRKLRREKKHTKYKYKRKRSSEPWWKKS